MSLLISPFPRKVYEYQGAELQAYESMLRDFTRAEYDASVTGNQKKLLKMNDFSISLKDQAF